MSDEFDFDSGSASPSSSAIEENDHPNKHTESSKPKELAGKSATKIPTKKARASSSKSKSPKKSPRKKTIEETYQKKTQLEHILLRPDTYIGSTEPLTQQMFVLHHSNGTNNTPQQRHSLDTTKGGSCPTTTTTTIRQREITYTPGLYKIFDEIVVNAADNKQRDPNMDRLEVVVDAAGGKVEVKNNGRGIPVEIHGKEGCWVPTLIFGHLLTGSNFDDNEKKTTGGRNGYGAKLANIFSKEFIVECVDVKAGKKFKQVWKNNMHKTDEPKIKDITAAEEKKGDYTKITFKPDLERFNMTHLDEDTVALLSKRAYDIAGSMANKEGKRLNVYLNGKKIPVKDFKSYLALFEGITPPAAYEKVGERWEIGISPSDGAFQQISFVNAIATTKGGGHVDCISDLVAKSLQAAVKKKNKGGTEIKPKQIKNHLSVFVNCLVDNPAFDSQTKENLTTRPSTFKSEIKLSDKFLKAVEKCGIVDAIVAYGKFKEKQSLQRKNGTKKSKLTGITKLDDANFAGTAKSKDCTLIITEGDSAKSLAVSGLSVVGRDYYGVFPLKGKPLNVRDSTHAQVMKNEEIMNLVEIMGLKFGTTYTEENIKALRYGHLMIMADQDHDGSHIKGLIINFIHHFWPSLLDVPDFLMQFITPIVKCTKGKKTHTFFTLPEYEEWKESTGNDGKGWTIKYYKGLGTSTSNEAKEYFSNLDIHQILFNEISNDIINVDDEDMDEPMADVINSGAGLIDMAFSKSKVNERKQWLSNVEKNTFLNYTDAQTNGVNYSDFINRELILFSQYDNVRSIPHVMDGFKPSQRKVLYACFKKKLKNEIKVAQLAGYIGEHSAYHHGDMSLNGAIIGMAQSYCGSNNVNLLYPSGQFGTRRMGGKDHASARYIFTRLEKIARAIFHPDDDALLNYLNDDGLSIEPEYYMPVIPMVLVNGSDGIGTGYSSTIQNHDPREIIANIRRMLNDEEPEMMHPYFGGFTGEIIAETGKKEGSYIVKGKIERTNDTTLLITELPVGKWTQDYKAFLEGMVAGTDKNPGEINDFKENHTDTTVSFTVNASKEKIDEFEKAQDGLYAKFKLSTTISTKNMTAFDVNGKLHKYATSVDILRVFFHHRLEYYVKRKDLLLEKLSRELKILDNKARFVEEVCKGDLVVSSRKRTELLAELQERGYDLFPKEDKKAGPDDEDEEEEQVEESASDSELAKGYEYLLGMKIWSLTFEKADELRRQLAEKTEEVNRLEVTKPESIWLSDLDAIEEALNERDVELDADQKKEARAQSKAKSAAKKASTKAKKGKKRKDEWDSDLEDSDLEDSDEEEDFVRSKPKPALKPKVTAPKPVTKRTPPKKTFISLGGTGPGSNKQKAKPSKPESSRALKPLSILDDSDSDDSFAMSPKKKAKKSPPAATAKATVAKKTAAPKVAKKPVKSAFSDDEEEMDDNESVASSVEEVSAPALGARSRRSRANVSYAVDNEPSDADQPSDEARSVESEDGKDDSDVKMSPADSGIAKKSTNAVRDDWDFDLDDDSVVSVPKPDPKVAKLKAKSSKLSTSVLESLSDDDGSQSDNSVSLVRTKKSPKATKSAAKKKVPPKKSQPAAKSTAKKKVVAVKQTKKSVCDLLSSDEDDFIDDDSVASNSNSDEFVDEVMEDVEPKSRRGRAKAKVSYADKGSSEEDFEGSDSDIEFD